MPDQLSTRKIADGLKELSSKDADLAFEIGEHGPPPLWDREPGYPTLVHIILEQQVSLASAQAAFNRLHESVDPLTPEGFLMLDDKALHSIGFSRQKAGYVRGLSNSLLDGSLELTSLSKKSDKEVREELIAVRGIGPWTAEIYLLMALGRPDAWPSGDLALQVAMQQVKRLNKRPDVNAMEQMAASWRPWRAVAARILWNHYLN